MKLNKKNVAWAIIPLLAITAFSVMFALSNTANHEFTENLKTDVFYNSMVCIKVKRANGEVEDLGCEHNILYDSGKELIEDLLGNTGSGGPANVIALCDASLGCGEPVADASETFNEITSCGLAPATGTYQSVGTGNWTISHTFTSTCDNVQTNVTRLRTGTGTNFAGRSFTLATLQKDDQLQITWYIWVQ